MQALNPKNFSTSNLYSPKHERVRSYLDNFIEQDLVAEFENRFSRYHASTYCISFSTGFWALVAAILCKATPHKGQVIMPSLTYRRLADVVNWTGKTPVFVDIDPHSLAISPSAIEAAINEETSLILAVHPIVNCCEVEQIIAISEKHAIPVLFDAVESVHETLAGNRIGSFNVGEVFSLHASKLINGVEGGYVCTNDEQLADKLRRIKNFREPAQGEFRMQADINPIHCAFAMAGLDEIDLNVAHNKNVYLAYRDQLEDLSDLHLLEFDESEQTSYKNIVVHVDERCKVTRDELVEGLNRQNVFARAHYSPPLHRKLTAYKTLSMNLDSTNRLAKRLINLPCGQRFDPDSAKTVVGILRSLTTKVGQ